MAQKSGKLKRFILLVIFLVLAAIVFVLLGGDKFLKSAGKKIEGVGQQAEEMKTTIEQKATNTGKAVEKVIDTVKQPGEKK